MAQNNFIVDLIAGLKKAASKKQVQSDAKNLGDIKVPLIGTLDKSKTKAQLKQDLSSLNGTVNLTGKVNKKGIVTSVQQATQQAQTTANKNTIQVRMSLKKDKLINDIKVFGQQNTKLFKDANMTAKYNSLLDNAKLATSNKEIKNLRLQLSAMRSEIKATHLSGLTLGDTFKKTFKRATELFTGTGVVMMLSQQLHKAWTEAINLDNVYTGLIKVQDELTRGDYPEYLEKCNKKAQDLATTQQSLIEGATEFSKSGYDLNTSDKLTEQSTILSNVGEMSASDSAKAIISGVQAYDVVDGYTDVVDKAQALIDKYNEIGNTASITTAEIAQGVQSVGSVFADANTSVDEFIALLAAGNRAYQDADSLALGLRTAALRIRGCTAELEQMGEETDGVYSSASKLQEKIVGLTNINGSGGVKILDEADGETFRSIYDIFVDISKVYKDMSDTDQSALLELIAGKHRASGISATLNNMSEAQEIYQRSLEASGSAQEEYDKYLQSSEASLNKFKASMIETYQSVINGNTTKGILDAGNAALQFANNIGLVESSLKGLIAIGVVKAITMMSTAFKASAIQASNFGTALNTVNNMSSLTRGTTEYTNALNTLKTVSISLSEAQLKQVLANKTLSDSERVAILQTTGLTRAQAQAKLVQLGLTQSTKAQSAANATATASTFSLTAAVKGLAYSAKAVFMSNPIGISIMALSTAIGAISSAIDSANQKLEEARQKAVELANAYNQEKSSLDSQIEKYKELKETLDNSNLSTDETRSIKEQLLEIQKSLIDSYGNEASNIDLVNGKYKEQLGLLSELSKEKATDFVTENRDVFNDAKEALDEVRKFELGVVTSWNSYVPKTEEQQKLIEFLETYSDLLDLTYSYANDRNGYTATAVNLSVKANVENADEVMHQLAEDLEKYGKDNNIDVSGVLDNIPEQLRNIWTDELKDYKTIYDEFMKAEIIRNDTLRPLYQQSIQAVEDYNNALSSGEGVEEAKANLDSVQQSVQNATGELEGSQDVFNAIYESINKDAEAAYNLAQAFENDKIVQDYAEQLRGLTDIDLKAINFEDDIEQLGEKAFTSLMDYLGCTEEQVQSLIDKLVELGYVQGKTSSDASSVFTSFTEAFNSSDFKDAKDKLLDLAKAGELTPYTLLSTKEYNTLLQETGLLAEDAYNEIMNIAHSDMSMDDWNNTLTNARSQISKIQDAISELDENGTSSSLIDTIISDYPQLLEYIGDEKALREQLKSLQEEQEDVAARAYTRLIQDSETYYSTLKTKEIDKLNTINDSINSIIKGNKTLVDILGDNYKIDLKNYKSIVEAKGKLETELIQNSAKAWSKFYQVQVDAVTGYAKVVGNSTVSPSEFLDGSGDYGAAVQRYVEEQNKQKKSAEDVANTYNSIIDSLNGIVKATDIVSGSGGSKSSSSSSKSFDWISTVTKRADEELDTLNDKISDTYATWEERTQALKDAFDRVTKSIELQKQAAEAYKEEANKIDLPESYKTLIKNGALTAKDVVDSDLADKISEYQTLYEKSIECTKTAEELQRTLDEIATSKQWDLIKNQFSASLDEVDFRISEIQNAIDILEMKGLYADEKYYNDMISLTQNKKATLESEATQLQSILSNMAPGTEAYNTMFSELMDIRTEVSGLEKDIVDFNKTIRDLNWEMFEYLEESINRITDETEYLVGLLENKDLFDENGNRTNYGDATIGLRAIAYETYKQQAQDYLEEANKLQKELVAGAGKDVLEQYNKMVEAHRDAVNSALDEKNAILDLIEDGYNAQLDALQELIDKKKEQLNAEKNLYDYQKNIKKQTDNISNLEKQQIAYNGDNSEEAMAKAQQLKVQLEDARNELQETEYEQYLQDTQNMLDTLSNEFESWISERLSNSDMLFEQTIEQISMQGSSITETLNSIAAENNTMISDSLSGITGSMDNYSSAVKTAIQGSIETTTQLITESNTSLTDSVSSSISTSLGITNGVISSAAGSIVSAENGTSSSVLQGASSIVGAIGSLGSSLSSSIYSMGSTIASSVSGAISGIKADVTKNANNISSLQSTISSLKSSLDTLSSRVSSLESNSNNSGGGNSGSGTHGTHRENHSQVSTYYASGTSNAKKGLAWTQEDGQEYIITKDGAMLTSLSGGELVLNNKASKLLYDFANSPEEFLRNMPSFVPNINLPSLDYSKIVPNSFREQKVDMKVGDITISLPNVTNYAEFRNELIKDKGFEKSILTTVNNAMMGKSTISKLKYVR